jgi:hypothetical protein
MPAQCMHYPHHATASFSNAVGMPVFTACVRDFFWVPGFTPSLPGAGDVLPTARAGNAGVRPAGFTGDTPFTGSLAGCTFFVPELSPVLLLKKKVLP